MAWKHQDSLSVMGRFLLLRRQHSALLYSTTVWYAVPLLYLERFVGKDEVGEQGSDLKGVEQSQRGNLPVRLSKIKDSRLEISFFSRQGR